MPKPTVLVTEGSDPKPLAWLREHPTVPEIAPLGFGMRVIYNALLDIPPDSLPFPATPVDKPTLYRESDVLSLHVTMIPGNENLVARDQLAMMKPTAILINTSRGEILDAQA